MRGSLRAIAAGTAVVFGGLRLLACGGDDGGAPGALGDDTPDVNLPERNLGPDPDAETNEDAGVNVTDPPTFCQGIVFYASLDGTYGPERGGTPGVPFANAKLVTSGKFGGAASLFEDGGLGDGAAVYYATPPDGGVPWYANDVGTVSLWYRGIALEDTGSPVLWRAMGSIPPDAIRGGGLALVSTGAQFGLIDVNENNQQQNILVVPRASARLYVDRLAYNHFLTAWNRGDAAAPPTAVMMINGGSGQVADAATDAPAYDGAPNDAGDSLVPYRAIRGRPWASDASALAFRIGGTGASASDGEIDDVVVWNRVLTFAEMQEVYAAKNAIGALCSIK